MKGIKWMLTLVAAMMALVSCGPKKEGQIEHKVGCTGNRNSS